MVFHATRSVALLALGFVGSGRFLVSAGVGSGRVLVGAGTPDASVVPLPAEQAPELVVSRSGLAASIAVAVSSDSSRVAMQERVAGIEEKLRPLFNALLKAGSLGLSSQDTRYLLFRYFEQHLHWQMVALSSSGEVLPFPTTLLESLEAQANVEQRFASDGLSLHQLAVVAAMLEDQVRGDALERLRKVWQAYGLKPESTISKEFLEDVVDTHTLTYMLPDLWQNLTSMSMSRSSFLQLRAETVERYPSWPRMRGLIRLTMDLVVQGVNEPGFSPGWGEAERATQKVIEHFGQWQEQDCSSLRQRLLSMEDSSSPGRVPLADFYGEGLKKDGWMFYETEGYLRLLGSLDENPPSVIIPNYVSSGANQVASSKYFDLSCADHCLDLLRGLELAVGSPRASSQQVMAAIAALPAWNSLSPAMLNELSSLREVELHSSRFGEWLHRAYPRDCQLPETFVGEGSLRHMSQEVYEARTGLPAWETDKGMVQVIGRLTADHVQLAKTPLRATEFWKLAIGLIAGAAFLSVALDFFSRMLLLWSRGGPKELFVL